jgi:hypothetical protein
MLVRRGLGDVWREHLLALLLGSLSYLMVLAGEYLTIQKALGSGVSVPESPSGELIRVYGLSLGVSLGLLSSFVIFLVICLGLVWWAVRASERRRRSRHLVASGLLIVYVGYSLAASFLSSLEWTSMISGKNLEVSSVLQTVYVFNLGAALSYLGLVLYLRRIHERLSIPREIDEREMIDQGSSFRKN